MGLLLMLFQILSIIPSKLLLILSISAYYLKKRAIKRKGIVYLQIAIASLSTFIFFIKVLNEYPSNFNYSPTSLLYIVIFQIILFLSFGIMIYTTFIKNDDIIQLKYPSRLSFIQGSIALGKILYQDKKKYMFKLSIDDLEKHMFVCGSTGTGKTNFIQNFLINFKKHYSIPFLLVEFKQEYNFLKKDLDNLIILKPGENFSLNIFNPEGTNPMIHAERIFDILKSGQFIDENAEYSPQMQKVLVEILTELCKNQEYQNWKGFYHFCDLYYDNLKNDIPMLSQTLISIKNRIRRFSKGPLSRIFDSKTPLKIKDLLKRDVLIDLSSIIRLGGEKEDALFFLNMILKYLWDENLSRGVNESNEILHMTIVEDAQYFVPKDLAKRSKLSTYLEDIALLQRGTGECLVSIATRPQISEEILANCGVFVIFKNYMEKELQCSLLNLKPEQKHFISILKKGECLIRVNTIKRPFCLKIPKVNRESSK
jgi:hypothetical protein